MSIINNIYILAGMSATTFFWALWYVARYERFRKINALKLYFYPCIYLVIAIFVGLNLLGILEKYTWVWIIILYPFFFWESIAVAERSHRLKIQQKGLSEYIERQSRAQQQYTKRKIEEYKVKFKKEKVDIRSWSKKRIFKEGYKRFDKK